MSKTKFYLQARQVVFEHAKQLENTSLQEIHTFDPSNTNPVMQDEQFSNEMQEEHFYGHLLHALVL